ncbi:MULTISPECIES: tyrosine-type recombinase/integrase [Thalassospira]|jgi:integrase/recombinase XerD|uniref:Integrase n=1 Tax=Thalassospira xiamenensis TaxID=220697 RepID=A0ABR5XX72_9PROT|nr:MULTISPECIES: tyrosine-type recombinase/integrase [Thalassospira]KZC98284.1 hypothetical protein AUP40_22055 [Thalassospira xiamenensis]KZD07201.1 hypothetical protein AUP45_19340 [Thalassospira xiamenensis]MAB32971.1 integrase [Thalassospira sp.]MAL29758.1 integrase [Thalassospira sp.]MBA06932.1 integrase [Thalassospira sp.]|tara:strand:- start:736 stop:1635 length:900 start_codon:yes stop_codon:yes gene_type:complete
MKLLDVINDFMVHCRFKDLSRHTLRAYDRDLKDYRLWFSRSGRRNPFEKHSILAWVEDMRTRNLAPASVKRRVACLRAMFRWLEQEERLDENPFHKLHTLVRLPRKLPRNLTSAELRLIFETSELRRVGQDNPELATLALSLELLLATGIRVGELCSITVGDIDLEAGNIRIRGKGNRERNVYIVDSELHQQITVYMTLRSRHGARGTGLLFSSGGGKVDPGYIRKMIHDFVGKLPLDRKVTPHMFRHTAATRLLERGVDIRFVQKLLGHASISTTEIYTHVSDRQLRTVVEMASPRRI